MRDFLLMAIGAALMLLAVNFVLSYWTPPATFNERFTGTRYHAARDGFCWPTTRCEVS